MLDATTASDASRRRMRGLIVTLPFHSRRVAFQRGCAAEGQPAATVGLARVFGQTLGRRRARPPGRAGGHGPRQALERGDDVEEPAARCLGADEDADIWDRFSYT